MEPVQALAILSLGAFLTGLVTAAFYVFTVRPRLLEPEEQPDTDVVSDRIDESLDEQRMLFVQIRNALQRLDQGFEEQRLLVGQLKMASDRHTRELSAAAELVSTGSAFDADLRAMLNAQTDAVQALAKLLDEQSQRLAQIDRRLTSQGQHLERLEQLRFAHRSQTSEELAQITRLIQTQTDRLAGISDQLSAWGGAGPDLGAEVTEQAHALAALSRDLAAQATTIEQLDARLHKQTSLLHAAADERREHAGILERLQDQLNQMFPQLSRLAGEPVRPGQDRLMDIRGIGPVYSRKLREAGIDTFEQLAAMSPEEVLDLIDEPLWRERSIDSAGWIEQARELAAQRKKEE